VEIYLFMIYSTMLSGSEDVQSQMLVQIINYESNIQCVISGFRRRSVNDIPNLLGCYATVGR